MSCPSLALLTRVGEPSFVPCASRVVTHRRMMKQSVQTDYMSPPGCLPQAWRSW